jgi:signal recognition particle receptor subunit beta
MAKMSSDETAVNARILYWGIDGAGKTTNLQSIHRKLRADHRGEIQREATLIDPAVEYETLAIELGEVGGLKTRIQMIAVPGSSDQAPTRKQLLDQVDGIVVVVDSQRERIEENASSLAELGKMLLDYGRELEDVPLVLQYNKRDLSDPYAIEELHRKLGRNGVAVFEAIATENSGVLQTLSTLSKHVIRSLRGQQFSAQAEAKPEPGDSLSGLQAQAEPIQTDGTEPAAEPAPMEPVAQAAAPAAEATATSRMEDAILSEAEHPEAALIDDLAASAQTALDIPWGELEDEGEPVAAVQLDSEFSIASVGEATRSGERGVRIPLVVSDKSGRTSNLVLTIQLDPEAGGDSS